MPLAFALDLQAGEAETDERHRAERRHVHDHHRADAEQDQRDIAVVGLTYLAVARPHERLRAD